MQSRIYLCIVLTLLKEFKKMNQYAKLFTDLPLVNRLGYGAMRITGPGIWGEPKNTNDAIELLRMTMKLGVNFIDTADSYGPHISESLIAEALYPYPDGLIIATKGGLTRPGPDQWAVNGKPEHLREACEGSLKRLKLDCIDLYQLHRIDPNIPLDDQIMTLVDLKNEGKIRHIGLSEVTLSQLKKVKELTPVVSVQNKYHVLDKASEEVLEYCTKENIVFIPWAPLGSGKFFNDHTSISQIAEEYKMTVSQLALAWLLNKSPMVVVIPGTSQIKHLQQNMDANITLSDEAKMKLNELSH